MFETFNPVPVSPLANLTKIGPILPSQIFVRIRRHAALGTSSLGGSPNLRVYSRLNWLTLS
jgi:hypothetical protein